MGRDPPPLTGPVWMLVHDRTLVHLDDGLRGWRVVTQGTVWSDGNQYPICCFTFVDNTSCWLCNSTTTDRSDIRNTD